MKDFGKVDVILDDYLRKNKISRSSLTRRTELQYSQILRYCKNEVQKLDLDILAKICTVLDCNIDDILKLTKGKCWPMQLYTLHCKQFMILLLASGDKNELKG